MSFGFLLRIYIGTVLLPLTAMEYSTICIHCLLLSTVILLCRDCSFTFPGEMHENFCLPTLGFIQLSNFYQSDGCKVGLITVSICISLIATKIGHLFTYLIPIYISLSVGFLLVSFDHFLFIDLFIVCLRY